jgi:hypothetical protein
VNNVSPDKAHPDLPTRRRVTVFNTLAAWMCFLAGWLLHPYSLHFVSSAEPYLLRQSELRFTLLMIALGASLLLSIDAARQDRGAARIASIVCLVATILLMADWLLLLAV